MHVIVVTPGVLLHFVEKGMDAEGVYCERPGEGAMRFRHRTLLNGYGCTISTQFL
jgi:hypothetical protein